jgi:hypothetical protein
LASLLLNPLLLTYLVFISFGKLREIVRHAEAQMKLEKWGAEIATAQLAGEKVPGSGVDHEPGHRFEAVASSAIARSVQPPPVDVVNHAITPDGFVDHFVAGGESKLAADYRGSEPPLTPSAAQERGRRAPTATADRQHSRAQPGKRAHVDATAPGVATAPRTATAGGHTRPG